MKGNNWTGKTVVCIASGPSLTPEDVQRTAHLKTIAVNSSWKIAQHADVIFAGDDSWWNANHDKITTQAERWTLAQAAAERYNLNRFKFRAPYNSGMVAIHLAAHFGASKIILLGYDCSIKHGHHWHGKHAGKNPDFHRCQKWKKQFLHCSLFMKKAGISVINCSRYTELTCFPRATLEEIL